MQSCSNPLYFQIKVKFEIKNKFFFKFSLKKWLKENYIENLETSNVQDTDVMLSLGLNVQSLVYFVNKPLEQSAVNGFAQSADGVRHLIFILAFVHIFISDLFFNFIFSFKVQSD